MGVGVQAPTRRPVMLRRAYPANQMKRVEQAGDAVVGAPQPPPGRYDLRGFVGPVPQGSEDEPGEVPRLFRGLRDCLGRLAVTATLRLGSVTSAVATTAPGFAAAASSGSAGSASMDPLTTASITSVNTTRAPRTPAIAHELVICSHSARDHAELLTKSWNLHLHRNVVFGSCWDDVRWGIPTRGGAAR